MQLCWVCSVLCMLRRQNSWFCFPPQRCLLQHDQFPHQSLHCLHSHPAFFIPFSLFLCFRLGISTFDCNLLFLQFFEVPRSAPTFVQVAERCESRAQTGSQFVEMQIGFSPKENRENKHFNITSIYSRSFHTLITQGGWLCIGKWHQWFPPKGGADRWRSD